MKKAFTLIELIASICILVILSTVIINVSIKKIADTKEDALDTLITSVELAAEQYVIDKQDTLTNYKNNNNIYISLNELINNDYLTNSLINPITKQPLSINDEVYVTRSYNGNIESVYDIDQNSKTKLILTGNYNYYIKIGETYTEPGVVNKNNVNIISSLTITSNVDTTKVGKYVIKYKLNNSEIKRNVIVY